MQIIFDSQNKNIIKMNRGEEVFQVLKSLAKNKNTSFAFSMIGALSLLELGYYDLGAKKYFSKLYEYPYIEIVAFSGSVAWCDDEIIVHAHGVFSNDKNECFGGHIMKAIISATGEVAVDYLPEKINRKHDEETGLKLMCLL